MTEKSSNSKYVIYTGMEMFCKTYKRRHENKSLSIVKNLPGV
jgi:hypothetical protein